MVDTLAMFNGYLKCVKSKEVTTNLEDLIITY